MASTGHSNGQSLVSQKGSQRISLKKDLTAMYKIASGRVTDDARNAPHDDPDPEPIKLGQQIVLRSQTPVPAAVLASLHSLYQNHSKVATELLTTVMEGDETNPKNTFCRSVIRTLFEE